MRPVQNLLVLDLLVEDRQIRRLAEALTIQIPDLDDAESLLGADCHPHDLVCAVRGRATEGRRCQIPLKHLHRVPSADLEAVRAAADVDLVLPQGADIAAHNAEETVGCFVSAELAENLSQSLPAVDDLEALVTLRRPGLVLWFVVINGPRSSGDRMR